MREEQFDMKKKFISITETERHKFNWLDKQIQQNFDAQRDRLFSQIKFVAVDQAKKELNIDRRVSAVM